PPCGAGEQRAQQVGLHPLHVVHRTLLGRAQDALVGDRLEDRVHPWGDPAGAVEVGGGCPARQAGRNAAHISSPPSGCSSAALRARWAASRNGWLRQASVQSRKTTSWPPDATLSRWRSPCDRTTGNAHAYSSRTAAASSASPSRRAARSPGSRSPTPTPSRSPRASPPSVSI